MTERTAKKVANVALGAAALGAAYIVVRTPPLRRMALGLAMTALTGALPAWLIARSAARLGSEPATRDMMARECAGHATRPAAAAGAGARARRNPADGAGDLAGVTGVYNSDDLTFASSIAYYALLSLFPFFLLALLHHRARHRAASSDRDAVLGFVFRYFPAAVRLRHHAARASCSARRSSWASLGSVLMVWAAMGVFGAVTSAVNHAWGVEKQPSYFKHKLISFVMLVVAGSLLLLGLLTVSAINVAEARWFAGVIAGNAAPARAAGLRRALGDDRPLHLRRRAGLLFRPERQGAVPRRVGRRRPDRAAVARRAGALLELRPRSVALQQLHGSIAAVVVFLLWVYVSAVILLYGVEVTAAYARLRRHRADSLPAAPTPRE